MRVLWATVVLCGVLTACGGRGLVSTTARCERGGYLESAAACESLSKNAPNDAERLRFKLLAARAQMWSCSKLDSSKCGETLEALWNWSDDPQEITTVLVMSQKACLAGVASGCFRARDAAWVGRGTPVDALASVAWNQRCPLCDKGEVSWGAWTMTPIGWPKIDAATRMERIRQIAALGAHTAVTEMVTTELAAGALAGHEPQARALLVAAVMARWAIEVDPLLEDYPLKALAAAEPLVALAKDDATLATRRDRMRAALAAPALERMTNAKAASLPLATWFHAARAAQLVTVPVPKVDLVALWAHLPSRPQITVLGTCDWARAPVMSSYPATNANLPVTVTLACQTEEKTWTTQDKYSWVEVVKTQRTRTIPGKSTTAPMTKLTCKRDVCTDRMNNGPTCYAQTYDCGFTGGETTTTPDREVEYTHEEKVPHDGIRPVTHRRLSVSVSGTLVSATGSLPVSFGRVVDEVAYSSPQDSKDSKSFSAATIASLQREAISAVTSQFAAVIAAVRAAEAAREVQAATVERDPLLGEEHLLRAVTLGDDGARLVETYKLASTVRQILDGASLALPEVSSSRQVVAMQDPPRELDGGFALSHYPREPKVSAEVPITVHSGQKGGVYRLIERTELVWDRSDRETTGAQKSTMLGARVERGWNLTPDGTGDFQFGWKSGLVLGGGGDGDLGGYFEARAGAAAGVLTSFGQLLLVGGGGYSGMGVRDTMGGASLISKAGIFYGVDLRFGLDDGFSFDGRLWQLPDGPMGDETRYAAQLLYRRESGMEIGFELSSRQFPDQKESITGFGAVLRAPDFFSY